MVPHISEEFPIANEEFISKCKAVLDRDGALVLPGFLTDCAVSAICNEGEAKIGSAFFCASNHNVYLTPKDEALDESHPFNRQVVSSKGLIADDQIDGDSPLKQIYHDADFQGFICQVVGEEAVYPYADPLSAVNLHFADNGQELGWHFDNSSFAITLLIQKPEAGSRFEYVRDLRDADRGEMNYDGVARVLDGETKPDVLEMEPGTLVLFRGRNSIHRVTPNEGTAIRMLAVLAYNSEPGISLSQSAQQTFYGRVA